MKKVFIFALFISATFVLNAQTKFFIEQNVKMFDENVIPTTTLGSKTIVNDSWSHGSFALITRNWAQVYYGATYSKGQVSIGLNLGLEQNGQDDMSFRFSPSLFWMSENNKLSYLLVLEKGIHEDDHWWTTHLDYHMKKISAGLMSRRYYGTGVRLQYHITKNFSIWGAPLYDTEVDTWKGVIAIKGNF